MQPCASLISAELVVTQNQGREIIREGAVAIDNGKIEAVGPEAELAGRFSPAERHDLGPALLMPGLINAHTHASMTVFRGFADDLPLMEWLNNHIFPAEARLTARMVELGALLGCAEMIRTGTTEFCDMYLLEEGVFSAAGQAGLRVLGGEALFAFPSLAYKNADEAFARARKQADSLAGNPLLRYAVMPHAVYTVNQAFLERCRDFAEELGLPLVTHLAESRQETEDCLRLHGVRPVEFCRRAGILGPGTTIAHGVDLEPEEQDLLAEKGVKISHNPKSNMKLASGVAPVPSMLARGLSIGLGTDGAASNNALNMFSEMNVCALLHKAHTLDPTVLPAGQVLDMATLHGAKALHRHDDGAGSLVPGAPADLAALDLTSLSLAPVHNPLSHLVYAASGHEVRLTMVAGKVLYKDGAFATLRPEDLRAEAQDIAGYLRRAEG